jgi:hypothetical protein
MLLHMTSIGHSTRFQNETGREVLTLATPTRPLSLPLAEGLSDIPKLCLPNRFADMVHERANVSSAWVETISSQSFERVVEYEIEVIEGNFRAASGIDSDVAFFTNDPINAFGFKALPRRTEFKYFTLRQFEGSRVTHY